MTTKYENDIDNNWNGQFTNECKSFKYTRMDKDEQRKRAWRNDGKSAVDGSEING